MKMSVLAWKGVAWFAAGVIAGAALGQLHRRTARPKAFNERTLPGAEPGHRRIEADRKEPAPENLTVTAELAKPVRKTAAPTQAPSGDTATDAAPAGRGAGRAKSGLQGLTKKQLLHEARKRNIRGRSTMTKAELQRALR